MGEQLGFYRSILLRSKYPPSERPFGIAVNAAGMNGIRTPRQTWAAITLGAHIVEIII